MFQAACNWSAASAQIGHRDWEHVSALPTSGLAWKLQCFQSFVHSRVHFQLRKIKGGSDCRWLVFRHILSRVRPDQCCTSDQLSSCHLAKHFITSDNLCCFLSGSLKRHSVGQIPHMAEEISGAGSCSWCQIYWVLTPGQASYCL